MDPVTISVALSAANTAFNAIKRGFSIGRDIEQMSGDVGRWMSAVSDIDNAEKMAKTPPLFGKLFKAGSVEEAALQAYAAKKKLEQQRQELKVFLNMTYGPQAYADLLKMEGEIRKQRQQTIYKQQQMRRHIGEIIAWIVLVAIGAGFLALIGSLYVKKAYGYEYKPKTYTLDQQIRQGTKTKPKYTTCRLMKQKTYKGKVACIYQGANQTWELNFEDMSVPNACPRQYKCVYKPNSKEPSIDDVMESLRSVAGDR